LVGKGPPSLEPIDLVWSDWSFCCSFRQASALDYTTNPNIMRRLTEIFQKFH
jgi:hypothetical protein